MGEIIIILIGLVLLVSSVLTPRAQRGVYRGLGWDIAFLILAVVAFDPLMGFVGGIVTFAVEGILLVLGVVFAAAVLYMIYRFIRRR